MVKEDKIHKLKEFIINDIVDKTVVTIDKVNRTNIHTLYYFNPIFLTHRIRIRTKGVRCNMQCNLEDFKYKIFEFEQTGLKRHLYNVYGLNVSYFETDILIREIKKRIYEKYLLPAYNDLTTNY